MSSISFCIASAKNEKYYTLDLLNSLEKHTDFNKHEILIFIDTDNQNTFEALDEYRKDKPNVKIFRNEGDHQVGSQRNISIMISQATKDVVVYLQSDMVVCPDFDKYFLEALDNNKNRIISAARIEPPVHPDSPEKITKDFGKSPDEFQFDEFVKFTKQLQSENREMMKGYFAPWGLYKETYLKVMGGFDTRFRSSREDSDFIIRLKANNVEMYQSWNASVYHYTCVSSRGIGWYKEGQDADIKNAWQARADKQELLRFIRKWGYFGHEYFPKYKTQLFIDVNTAPEPEQILQIEPFFDEIIINDEELVETLVDRLVFNNYYYTNKRWDYPREHWEKVRHGFIDPRLEFKIAYGEGLSSKDPDTIKLRTNLYDLVKTMGTPEVSQFIQHKNKTFEDLAKSDNYKGTYKIGCFEIKVDNLTDDNKNHLDPKQYHVDSSKFLFK